MKKILLLVALLSLGANAPVRNVSLDEFGCLFPLADSLEKLGAEARKTGSESHSERLLGQAEGYEKAAAMVRSEIAAIRDVRRKSLERAAK